MLVITRKNGQGITLSDGEKNIEVLLKIKNGHFEFCIQAPQEVKVMRSELVYTKGTPETKI